MIDPLAGLDLALTGTGGLEQAARARRGMWLHATLPRPPIGTSPHIVIHSQNKLRVRFYGPSPERDRPPVFIVPSLINQAVICDLEPDRSLVMGLSKLGHPVYLLDWGKPGPEDADQGVDTVLLTLLHRALDRACRHAGHPSAHVLGYCQGGTLSTMYTALRPDRVRSLTALATPVRFSEGGRFRDFAQASDIARIVGADGLVDVGVMSSAFKLLDPMGNWSKYVALESVSRDPRKLARTLARERWLEENVPLAGRFATEFIQGTYVEDRLLEGTFEVGGEVVDLGEIRCPVMVNAAARDFIAPPASCLPLAKAVGSEEVCVKTLQSGHIGCVVGGYGPKVYYPMLDEWFRSH